jgi:hypothetical protein
MTTYQIAGSPDYPGTLLSLTEDGGAFTLANDSTNGAIITSIHFESEVSLTVADASQYVHFTAGDQTLPQGHGFSFESLTAWLADSPAPKNGIGAGERLSFALDQPYAGRIGFHVQSIGDAAKSATYLATVPEPGAAVLFLSFAAVAFLRRKR